MTNMIERVARAIASAEGAPIDASVEDATPMAIAAVHAMKEPTDAQWDGLARQIIMWMDMEPKTPRALFKHLERSGYEIPQWLRDEPEMKNLDHVPSKGTRAVLVYRAMIDAALTRPDAAS